MTVKAALKYKNKLTSKMNDEFVKLSTYNSVDVDSVKPYSASEALVNYLKMSEELVTLKTKIHLANAKVYDKIFLLSELKSQALKLAHIDCSEGKISKSSRFSRMVEGTEIKVCEITILERDKMVSEIEEKIELIQDELDYHNTTTII
jgi:hypothetical protein